jgi:hypothetical protein
MPVDIDPPSQAIEPHDFARRGGIANLDHGQQAQRSGSSFAGGLISRASTGVIDAVSGSVLANPMQGRLSVPARLTRD